MTGSSPTPGSTAPRSPGRPPKAIVLVGLMALGASWAWQQPFFDYAVALYELSRQSAPTALPVPVAGVAAGGIADTFGAPRGENRQHQGVDIFAPRGTPVRSTTPGLVMAVRDEGLGGRQVWVLGPGHQRHYYAHLDSHAPGLSRGKRVRTGDPLGTVGDSGNARGTPPHLHYGIYGARGAIDPLPLVRAARADPGE